MVSKIIKTLTVISFLVMASVEVFAQATVNSLDQNADQSQGQYVPMNMGYAGFNSLGMTQSAWLDPLQNLGEGQSKPGFSKYYWSPELVLPVRLREGMMTLINFPEWELIEDIFIGDTKMFDGQITGPNTLLLYPRGGGNVGVDTNIIVFGRSGNRYVFYAKSEGVNTERLTNSIIDIEVIGAPSGGKSFGGRGGRGGASGGGNFNSSGDRSVDALFTRRFQKNDWIKNIPLDVSKFRFDLEVYIPNPEDVIIAPDRVWRDDIFTYIDLGEKSLSMTQRPIVTMIVERIEVPVSFRTKGPNNRLIIVEGIGDMVLRNGKRLICIKLRRSDAAGLEHIDYAEGNIPPEWDVPKPLPDGQEGFGGSEDVPYNQGLSQGRGNGSGNGSDSGGGVIYQGSEIVGTTGGGMTGIGSGSGFGSNAGGGSFNGSGGGASAGSIRGAADNFDYSKMQRIQNSHQYSPAAQNLSNNFGYGSGFINTSGSNISIELGTDADVSKLETLWEELSDKYTDLLSSYDPYFSVDTPADGQGRELFHLRVGPVDSIEKGDSICSRLGRNGIFCSVVRTQ